MNHIPRCPGSYKITHTESGFFYVGSSKNVKGRIRQHLCSLMRGDHINQVFQDAFISLEKLKIEFNAFETIDEARDSEQTMIDLHIGTPLCCNVGNGARSTWQKGAAPAFMIEHNREKSRGNQYAKGHVVSEEVKAAVRAANTGLIRSKETLDKMSASKAGLKRAMMINGVTYAGSREASIALGLSKETIRSRVLSTSPVFAGWVFI